MEVAETSWEAAAHQAAFTENRRRVRAGDDEGAIAIAESIAAEATEPRIVVRALMLKLASVINVGRMGECPALLDEIFETLDHREHSLLGGVHALGSIVASQSSLERCVRHLVHGLRELDQVENPGLETVDAWHNLAVSFSYVGFHRQAMATAERGYLLGQKLGLAPSDHALPEVSVRRALALDHRGDAEGCVRVLRDVLDTWSRRTNPSELWRIERHYYEYAAVRLALLGEDVSCEPDALRADLGSWEAGDLRLMTGACVAIRDGRPSEALDLLAGRTIFAYTLGAAEIFRVRALAHAARGDYQAALKADRESVRLATEVTDQLRDRLVDGVRTQLDHEALRRTVERYASEALTDPLTGLPNRRHFDRRIVQNSQRRVRSALGIIDLDNFKAVNTVHGHAGGDLVLQRVAAVLARSVRSGDFVARYGGDEFIVVLPDTDLTSARQIGERMARAVAAEDWQALVAGTPVSITIGWAELSDVRQLSRALEVADHQMLAVKARRPTPQEA